MPDVTVVMPLYNKAPYVARAVRSVLSQTYGDLELVVVDDGSTDGGADRVRGFADPRVRVVTQDNAGPARARNAGVALARGDLVAFLDADDEWLPSLLERAADALQCQWPGASAVGFTYRDADTGRLSTTPVRGEPDLAEGEYAFDGRSDPRLFLRLVTFLTPSSTVVRRAALDASGGFFDRERCTYGEDEYLWIRLALDHRVVVSREVLAIRHGEASALSAHRERPHPVEPFLTHAAELLAACPDSKRRLLRQALAIRAARTAAVYAKHGEGRRARELLRPWGGSAFREGRAALALSWAAPALPRLRAAWRRYRDT